MSETGESCRLCDSVLTHLGQNVLAYPMYGWGWGEGEGIWSRRNNTKPVEVPMTFHFKVDSFFDWNGERRGGVGQIIEPNHAYDQEWLMFFTRACGVFDFSSKIADYNFFIGKTKPSLHPPSYEPNMAERWPLPNFSGPIVDGFGWIGSTRKTIVEFEEYRERKARSQRHA